MPVIGVTGGIASGKSTVTLLLAEYLQKRSAEKVVIFSADECSHELLEQNSIVRAEILQAFGESVLDDAGKIDRSLLRQIVFTDLEPRKILESILHPKIHKVWFDQSRQFHTSAEYFVAEIPLLYETKSSPYFDCIVVVEADTQVQLERLSSKRGWSLETAQQVIDAQMPADEKRKWADILILNQHTEKLLRRQIELAVGVLFTRYA